MFNSFTTIRTFSDHAGGNVGGPLNLGAFSDGDTLNLSMTYDLGTDTFDVEYGINGGAKTNLANYTGAGNSYGIITAVQMFKFGDNDGPATAALDNFNLSPIPEPTSAVLLGIGFSSLLLFRRRRAAE